MYLFFSSSLKNEETKESEFKAQEQYLQYLIWVRKLRPTNELKGFEKRNKIESFEFLEQ